MFQIQKLYCTEIKGFSAQKIFSNEIFFTNSGDLQKVESFSI